MSPDNAKSPLEAFIEQYLEDQAAGEVQILSVYLDSFPGDVRGISARYLEFEAGHSVPATVDQSEEEPESEGSLGPYQLLEEIGRGGQGVVYLAEDSRLGRKVALKVLRGLGPGSESLLLRFKREAAVAAKLEHPGICAVHEAGVIKGVPYIDMQYVEGENLSRKISTARESDTPDLSTFMGFDEQEEEEPATGEKPTSSDSATPKSRADLMRVVEIMEKAARALHAAHEVGILHRDIKPGNVMVTPQGEPVILDFGLARDEGSDIPTLTQSGDLMGTPAYMSPEQLARHSIRLDRRTDIWSLGVMLYECVTLKRPFDAPTREAVYQAIMTKDPADVKRLNPSVPEDLRTVLEKALEKDRDRRYETALAFADELKRVREYEPIHARPITRWIKVKRWTQRNPRVAVSLSALMIVLAVGTTISINFALRARDESRVTRIALGEKERALRGEQSALAESMEEEARALRASYFANVSAAEASLRVNDVVAARHRLELAPTALRHFEWQHFHARLDQSLLRYDDFTRSVWAVAWHPTRDLIASGGKEEKVVLIDLATGSRRSLAGHRGTVACLDFSADGSHVISAGSYDHTARIWDVTSGRCEAVLRGHKDDVMAAALSHDGRWAATGALDCTVKIWDTSHWNCVRTLRGHTRQVRSVAFDPEGPNLASGSFDGSVRVWNAITGECLATMVGHLREVHTVAFHPDGSRIASASRDGTIRLWDCTSWREILRVQGHAGPVKSVTYDPSGELLVSGARDRTIRIWDARTGRALNVLSGHGWDVDDLAACPDGQRLASASPDCTLRIWDLLTPSAASPVRVVASFSDVDCAPEGHTVAAALDDTTIRIWDSYSGELLKILEGHLAPVQSLTYTPSGRHIVSGGRDGSVLVWDLARSEITADLAGHRSHVDKVRVSSDGSMILSASRDKTLRLWDIESGKLRVLLKGHTKQVNAGDISPDGQRIVSGSSDKTIRLWDAHTGRCLQVLKGHEGIVWDVEFSPNGRLVASVSYDKTARLWDAFSGSEIAVLRGHTRGLRGVRFHPDGTRLVTTGIDSAVKLWTVPKGEEVTTLWGHENWVYRADWTQDGTELVTAGALGMWIWSTANAPERIQRRRQFLKIRARAKPHLTQLRAELGSWRHVEEKLLEGVLADPELNATALRMVQTRLGDPDVFWKACWDTMLTPDCERSKYVMMRARAACLHDMSEGQDPPSWCVGRPRGRFWTLVGGLHYRCGAYKRALTWLSSATSINQSELGAALPEDLAFRAMAQARLGRRELALGLLHTLRDVLAASEPGSELAAGLLTEVEMAIARSGR